MLLGLARASAIAIFALSLPVSRDPDALAVDSDIALENSQLSLSDRPDGGIVDFGSIPRLVLSYDWNEGTYRAVAPHGRRRGLDAPSESVQRVAKLSPAEFLVLMDRVAALGLADLPVENPFGSEDLYRRHTLIEYHHRGRTWRNGFPTGCEHGQSKIQPTAEQRERFDAVLQLLTDQLQHLSMQEGSLVDLDVMELKGDWQTNAYRSLLRCLKDRAEFGELDFNRAVVSSREGGTLRFDIPWREVQHPAYQPESWPGVYSMNVKRHSLEASLERAIRPKAATSEARARRNSFVLLHPDLSEHDARLIKMGWVDVGMTEEAATASWGCPKTREERFGSVLLRYRPEDQVGTLEFRDGCLRSIVWPPR